jgi:hypothetical protein
MKETTERKLSSLLQQGLEFYGTGDVARAFLSWSEVLEIDPGNEEALDYMRDADRRSKPRGENVGSIVEDARRLLRAENEEAALELLSSAPSEGCLEMEAMIELLRSSLFRRYRGELGGLTQIPRMVEDNSDLQGRNLPSSAGFLLSMIDGLMSLSDLVSVSGMDRFEALRSIYRMHEAGILEWDE